MKSMFNWFQSRQEIKNELAQAIQEERNSFKKLIDAYKEQQEYYKAEAKRQEDLKWQEIFSKPQIEFILGDRETGWVWRANMEQYKKLNIGSIVELYKGYDFKCKFEIVKFDGFEKNVIVFYVKEIENGTRTDNV